MDIRQVECNINDQLHKKYEYRVGIWSMHPKTNGTYTALLYYELAPDEHKNSRSLSPEGRKSVNKIQKEFPDLIKTNARYITKRAAGVVFSGDSLRYTWWAWFTDK